MDTLKTLSVFQLQIYLTNKQSRVIPNQESYEWDYKENAKISRLAKPYSWNFTKKKGRK